MNGVKNGITLVGRYAGEALNNLYEKTLDPLLEKITNIDFADSYFSNPAIPKSQKYSAFQRNLLRNEDAFLGIGEYPTGEKHGGGLKEILVLLGLLAAAGGGMAIAKKYELGTDDISATIAYLEAKAFGASSEIAAADSLAPTPTPVPTAAKNATVKETAAPERYQLNYDGILIKGDKQFIKDVVISLEFGKEYYPEGELKYTKEIKATNATPEMAAGQGYTSVNPSSMRKKIENGWIKTALSSFAHEEEHNYRSLNDPKNNTEENAGIPARKVWESLFSINASVQKEFAEKFDFSKYEKDIQSI